MHHVLVKDNKVAHVWKGPIPKGIGNTYAVAPGSAHVGDEWDAVSMSAVPKPPMVTPDEVNAECERRILERYPVARQLNILDEGSQAELSEFKDQRNGLRACARALILMQPIPGNYRDDRFWSGVPFGVSSYGAANWTGAQQQMGMMPNGMGMQMLPGYGAHTNQPIIMMQAPVPPAPAAPIIINGASPGTTVIQGPAQVQQPQAAPHINLVSPVPQQVASLPVQSQPQPEPQRAMGLPSPRQTAAQPPLMPGGLTEHEQELVYETAARAMAGQDYAIGKMEPIARLHGMSLEDYCNLLLAQRHEKFEQATDKLKRSAQG